MSAAKRDRSVANHMVSIDQYREVFDSWLQNTVGTIPAMLGKDLVADLRAVTPSHVVAIVGLLELLLSAGCWNAMILPSKFEAAIRLVFAAHPLRVGKSSGLDLYAHDVCEHIKQCFSMLRHLRREQTKPLRGNCSKTACFKRKATTAENIVTNNLVAKVQLESADAFIDAPHASMDEDVHMMAPFSLPTCFAAYLGKSAYSSAPLATGASTPASSPRSTVFYDEDGWPMIGGDLCATPVKTQQLQPSNDLSPPPVMPSTRARKKATLAKRAELKDALKSQDGGKAGLGRVAGKGMDVQIHGPRKTFSKGRLELCALDEYNKRVFIFGGRAMNGDDSQLEAEGKAVMEYIERTAGVTKAAALAFRAQLRSKRG